MAITQVANPSSVPSAVADYEAQNAHISAFNNLANNQAFILTNSGGTGLPAIKLGTYIQYGGNLYVVDTGDYAITGTPIDGNNYIRISGTTTLTAEWIQDISSYVWNEVYGYKYTGSYALLPYLIVKDGTEYAKYSLYNNNVAFNGTILDKYGREVRALQIKTIRSEQLTGTDLAEVTIEGFGFQPTALIRAVLLSYETSSTRYSQIDQFYLEEPFVFTSDGITMYIYNSLGTNTGYLEVTLAG